MSTSASKCSSHKTTMPTIDDRSWATDFHARRTMQANRRRDTKPELAIRRILHARGLRYRTDVRPDRSIRRHADIVFTKAKIAVFVDGCFWHGCPEHFIPPKANADYWAQKIEGNQKRDANTNDVLKDAGWTVLRFWEHDDPASSADRIEQCWKAKRQQA